MSRFEDQTLLFISKKRTVDQDNGKHGRSLSVARLSIAVGVVLTAFWITGCKSVNVATETKSETNGVPAWFSRANMTKSVLNPRLNERLVIQLADQALLGEGLNPQRYARPEVDRKGIVWWVFYYGTQNIAGDHMTVMVNDATQETLIGHGG